MMQGVRSAILSIMMHIGSGGFTAAIRQELYISGQHMPAAFWIQKEVAFFLYGV